MPMAIQVSITPRYRMSILVRVDQVPYTTIVGTDGKNWWLITNHFNLTNDHLCNQVILS